MSFQRAMHRAFGSTRDELVGCRGVDAALTSDRAFDVINLAGSAFGSLTAIFAVLGKRLAVLDAYGKDARTCKDAHIVSGTDFPYRTGLDRTRGVSANSPAPISTRLRGSTCGGRQFGILGVATLGYYVDAVIFALRFVVAEGLTLATFGACAIMDRLSRRLRRAP